MGGNLLSAEITRRMEGRTQAGSDGGMKRKCSREKKRNQQTKLRRLQGKKTLGNKAKEEMGDKTVVVYEM